MRRTGAGLFVVLFAALGGEVWAQSPAPTARARAAYLQRGDEVDKRYGAYRQQLDKFFAALSQRVKIDAPELLPKITPPLDVPYGYQILPTLLPTPPWRPRASRVTLSPFSWSRTDSLMDRDRAKLAVLETRLDDVERMNGEERRRQYVAIADEYKKLVAGQKFLASLIAYNKLWQSEIARLPQLYKDARGLQNVALAWQAALDSLSAGNGRAPAELRHRADSVSRLIDAAITKLPTPDYVRVAHPTTHRWVISVPIFTDISDSAFVERFRNEVQNAWHVRDGDDEFSVALEIQRVPIARLYPQGNAPAVGAHIDISSHLARFPAGGVILTTGANGIYSTGRSVIIGPHAIAPTALVHEFGHMLGFKDGYFRSYEDEGADGYRVLEVILDSENVIAAPENGRVRREHFEQVIREGR